MYLEEVQKAKYLACIASADFDVYCIVYTSAALIAAWLTRCDPRATFMMRTAALWTVPAFWLASSYL